jgi:hypothetical protein
MLNYDDSNKQTEKVLLIYRCKNSVYILLFGILHTSILIFFR